MQFFYTVRQGDTVSSIAKRWGLPIQSLIAGNSLLPPYTIYPGWQLSIPPGVDKVRVKEGDSLYQLAQNYGIPLNVIIQANGLRLPYMIEVGQILQIPVGVPYYTVQPGDSLYLIASRYQVLTSEVSRPDLIMQANRLTTTTISPGMKLVIPYAPPGGAGWIAYTTDEGGSYDIWLYHLLDGSRIPLTKDKGEDYSVPYWSPDGRKIAFIGKERILYVVEVTTGSMAEIDEVEPYTLLDWSTNNREIAYAKKDEILLYDTAAYTSESIPQPGVSDAQWFPSGKELAFTAPDSDGISQLYRIDRDGSGKKQLTQNTEGPMHNVRLSPDGTFALYTTPGASVSIIMTVHLVTGKTFTLEGGPLSKNYSPVWSPNSMTIAYSSTFYPGSGYYSYVQTDRSTGHAVRTWAISNCFSTKISWAPDGNQFVYLSGCTNEEQSNQLWLVDLRRPVPIGLFQGGHITAVQWAPTSQSKPPLQRYSNNVYHVSFPYPSNWTKVNEERYAGADGFFQVAAVTGSDRISEVCQGEAFHILKPYGSQPKIIRTKIQNQEACYIYPSNDQPKEMNRQAALVVRYPEPIVIRGTTYHYFILWTDQPHIYAIGQGLEFE